MIVTDPIILTEYGDVLQGRIGRSFILSPCAERHIPVGVSWVDGWTVLHIAVLQDLKPLDDFDTDRKIVGNQGMEWDWGVKLEEVIKVEDVGIRCMRENDLFNPTFLAEGPEIVLAGGTSS